MSVNLDMIGDYRDLASLEYPELEQIAGEIRERIIDTVGHSGGHLASSLGAVELIIALLRVFDPEKDRIVFDVGHQAYAYKILTGRKDIFGSLRQWGGISGFPDPKESPYDHFNGGHSSKSLSAALGLAKARDILGRKHNIIAVIGDGSLINGLALEALNHAHEIETPAIFVLNDNQMSISNRVGGMANHLAALSVNPFYKQFKNLLKFFCKKVPSGKRLESFLEMSKQKIKGFLLPPNMFEDLGISYWGPFDGHDLKELEKIFRMAGNYEFPLLIHVLTRKGKGLEAAEMNPEKYHGISPKRTPPRQEKGQAPTWSEANASCIEEIASRDPRIVLLTAAMKEGSKLNSFAERFPERFFDVGIAEGHLLTFAAGMASEGLIPVVSVYSTFLQRAMDQLVHDVCMQNLPVILTIDRAGLVGEDGETHHGLLDVPWTRPVPNITVMAPRDLVDLRSMLLGAVKAGTPCSIRFPRGNVPLSIRRDRETGETRWGRSEKIYDGSGWSIFAYGSTVPLAVEVFGEAWKSGLEPPSVYDIRFLKPMDSQTIIEALSSSNFAVALEDCQIEGGLGEKIAAMANAFGIPCTVRTLGVPDRFIPHGSVHQQWEACNMVSEEVMGLYEDFKKGGTSRPGNSPKRTGRNQEQGSIPDTGGSR